MTKVSATRLHALIGMLVCQGIITFAQSAEPIRSRVEILRDTESPSKRYCLYVADKQLLGLYDMQERRFLGSILGNDDFDPNVDILSSWSKSDNFLAVALNRKKTYMLFMVKLVDGNIKAVSVEPFYFMRFWKKELNADYITARYQIEEMSWRDDGVLSVTISGIVNGEKTYDTKNVNVYTIEGRNARLSVESATPSVLQER